MRTMDASVELTQIQTQLIEQGANLVGLYHQALKQTLFTNHFGIRPDRLEHIAAAEAEVVLEFFRNPDQARARQRGAQLGQIRLSKEAVFGLCQATRRFCLTHLPESLRLPALEVVEAYHGAMLHGFIQAREAIILEEQERIRAALRRALNRYLFRVKILRRIQSLNQISFKVQGVTSFPDLLAVIGGELEQFGCHCVIALLNSDGTSLEVQCISSGVATSCGIPDCGEGVPPVSVDKTVICRQVLGARTGRFVSDIDKVMAELFGSPIGLECQSAFVGPLVANNRALGLLALGLNDEHLDDFSLLMAFANQVAATIEICRLQAELQQRLAELQSVLAIVHALVSAVSLDTLLEFIMAQAEHLTNAEGAVVLLLDDDGQWLEVAAPGESWLRIEAGSRLPVQGSPIGLAMASQKTQTINAVQDDDCLASVRALLGLAEPRSLLCAPLIAQEESLGVLLVWNKRRRAFTVRDSRLMDLLASQAALALYNAQLHDRNRQLAVERERHRLARELHDSVTQSLYGIGMAAQALLKLLGQAQPHSSMVRDPVEYILELSRTALTEMREQLSGLHPTVLAEKGLVEAIAQNCDLLRGRYSLAIELTADIESPLSMAQREGLYYISKEALWNVIKHAGATQVDILLTRENEHVVLSIADDGGGFDPSALGQKAAIGLRNMEERTKLLGGTLDLQSSPGQGTRVTVWIPV
jgi:signal transduction histidine kinase